MIGLLCGTGNETMTIMLSRFHRIPERNGQTDRQNYISISHDKKIHAL